MPTIRDDVPFIPDKHIERKALELLERHANESGDVLKPPVPIEEIAELTLGLGIDWDIIADPGVLAYIYPEQRLIRFNEAKRNDIFDVYKGIHAFTLAHEVGHWELHVSLDELPPTLFDVEKRALLCRGNNRSSYEFQADKFAAYLLMPSHLVTAEVDGRSLRTWAEIYALRDIFHVSATAMKRRLQEMGLIYIIKGQVYPSKEDYSGQLNLLE